jgi:hypothetical protein
VKNVLIQHTDEEKMKVISLLEKVGVLDKENSEWAFCGQTPYWSKGIGYPFHDRYEDEQRGSTQRHFCIWYKNFSSKSS